jgi:hypothetical protein
MTNIQETIDKLAVIDALYRFAAGIDLRDSALLSSSLAKDAISDFGPAGKKVGVEFPILQGRENIVAMLTSALSKIDTTHSVSNPRVNLNGDKAVLDALVEAQHLPSDDLTRHFLMKNRYDVELIKQDEVWVIQRYTVDNVWQTGDPAVLFSV